ncbi:DUF3060 domain-containing protein [Pseudoleptotrichia goodfellowii]|uniref:DUF3060 domain-containing protein n=1 Tax=Pseudoleptotrichia goodfellowii TaxID=157692 RepID=A0A510JC12_9FUSO|nr:DUF3060 domain-containing protein [Pseudoleptotrichia goodfellowii]BBM35725.1 hypothetical protein JCM16774_0655 [Pseudoleptotrichia goodfellowii]
MKKFKNILIVVLSVTSITACTGIGVGVGIPIGPVSVGLGTTIGLPKGSDLSSKVGKVNGRYMINGDGLSKTVTLKGEPVEIIGSSNRLIIKGRAVSINITGTNNIVEVDSTENVNIDGENNKVSYKTSTTEAKRPNISISGAGSEVYKRQ